MRVNTNGLLRWWMLSLLSAASFGATNSDIRLVEAVKNQDKEAIRVLLKQHVDVNIPAPDGGTALHWAAHWDDLGTADLLIRAGARANVANDYGVTPLSLACTNGNAAMVEKLLTAGANPNAALWTGETALMTCARTGNVAAVKALLVRGADPNAKGTQQQQTALMWAVTQDHAEVVQVLIERGADLHARSRVYPLLVSRGDRVTGDRIPSEIERGGSTPLLFAARQGALASARLLVAAGANVNDAAPDGASALAVAALSGQGALAAFLLEKGADPNDAGAGHTALHAAVLRGDLNLVKALLAHGANPNAEVMKATAVTRYGNDFALTGDMVGATPFLLAAQFADVSYMRVLAANGADPRATMADGTTALMLAARIHGAGGGGFTLRGRFVPAEAFAEAQDESRTLEAVKLAVDLGLDVNATNQDGDTALHGAAANGFNRVIEFLADSGAKLDVRNKSGKTPLGITLSPQRGGQVTIDFQSTENLLRKLGAKE